MNTVRNVVEDYKLLLRSVPGTITMLFCISVVVMNLMANKVIINLPIVAVDGGILLSWIAFLCMDTVTKHFGAKAAIKLNIVALFVNLFFVAIFAIIANLQIEVGTEHVDYSAFNSVFSCNWFILLGSSVAFLISGIINNMLNEGIGKMFVTNPNGRVAYYTRAYVSTFIGQFFDNLIFAVIVFMIFAPIYWGYNLTFIQCVGAGILGAIIELFMEIVFSPLGYKLSISWRNDSLGQEYIEKYK